MVHCVCPDADPDQLVAEGSTHDSGDRPRVHTFAA
jgi:hypothetical protein